MFVRTDDPYYDFDQWDAEQARYLARLPKCSECGQPIQDEEYYEIDGKFYCSDCLETYHRHYTEDYANAYLD